MSQIDLVFDKDVEPSNTFDISIVFVYAIVNEPPKLNFDVHVFLNHQLT